MFVRIGRFEPTSQICSGCGVKDGPKPLHVRVWQCRACGVVLDRDINAAVNVALAAGLAVSAPSLRAGSGSQFDDVEAVYEQGEQALAGFLPEIEESTLAGHLAEAEQTAEDRDEFIKVKKWTLDGRILTAGVIQQGADLPVMVVVALEEPGTA
ncbi:zinc ribbon domain-containing protein [Streptomyces gelaticus]|uniref:zinc ribbon domain-containing protein n=1 Tax=Streptomyces gelaticus TaxID=285446 RepID=UPI0037B902B6